MVRMKVKMRWIYMSVLFMLCQSMVFGQIRFRLRPYLGIGISRTMEGNKPAFEIEDPNDQFYYDLNLTSLKRHFLLAEVRLNLIEIWHFSIGYMFWGHQHEYPYERPEFWARENKNFPHSYHYSLHGVVLQWNAKYSSVFSEHFVPYVIVGGGRMYGSTEFYYFEFENIQNTTNQIFQKIVKGDQEYTESALFFGIGTTVFKYFYIYLEYIDFRKNYLPESRFVNIYFGVTL